MKKCFAIMISLIMVVMSALLPVKADVLESTTTVSLNTLPVRVRGEETAMNTDVYDNGDGTYTLNVYNYDIEYVDSKGSIVDKTNRLILDCNNNYYNPDNDIITKFPQNLSNGISMQYKNYNIFQ